MTIKEKVLREVLNNIPEITPEKEWIFGQGELESSVKKSIDLTLAEVGKVIDEEDNYQIEQIAKYISILQKFDCFKPKEKREVIAWLTQQLKFKDKIKQKLGIK